MVSRNSVLRLVSKMDIITRPIPGPYILTSELIETAPHPLGRWCHRGYNPLCDTDRKIDLANSDNSLCVKTE